MINIQALVRISFIVLAGLLAGSVLGVTAFAQDLAAASKSGGASGCETTNTGPFTITPGNTKIRWSATRFDSPPCPTGPGAGNDFWLDRMDGPPLNDLLINGSIGGFGSGELDLPPGTYQMAINLALMGAGNYSIEYNLETAIELTPPNRAFTTTEDSASAPATFSVASTGDLPVTLSDVSITGPEAAHFEIVGANPVGDGAPASFQVRCTGDNSPGPKSATLTVEATSDVTTASDSATLTCDVEALVPDISCLTTTDFGDANQTIPEIISRSVIIENEGTAALTISTPVFSPGTPAQFSFVGTPPSGAIAPGSSVAVPIQFDSTGAMQDQVFTGALTVLSDDPDESPKSCGFRARAHEPRPIMRVEPAGPLDFREVELGFAFTKPILVYNDGDATLNATVSDDTQLTDDPSQWSTRESGAAIIPPGSPPAIFRQVCEPVAEGSFSMTMNVTGNDLTNPSQQVTMLCEGIPPVPIDSVLVLDRSGSMDERLGGPTADRKIEVMRRAAGLFADLLNMRAESLPDVEADKIGLVRYNNVNDTYLPLDIAKGGHFDTLVNNRLDLPAISDPARLNPEDATGIGGAMETAGSMLVTSPADRKHVMVLLTDGRENREPWIADARDAILAADPELDIYSVGLGSDGVIDAGKLQATTNVGNDGFHQVEDDLTGLGRFALETFYFKIFSDAADLEMIVDPTFIVDLTSAEPRIVDTARVTSSDKRAYFLALDTPAYRPFYDLELVSPTGDIMTIGADVGGVPVQVKERNTYRIFRVVFPDLSLSGTYVGTWTLRIRPNGRCRTVLEQVNLDVSASHAKQRGPCQTAGLSKAPIGFGAAVASNYKLDVTAIPSTFEPGALITLTAQLSDRGWPAVDGDVFVDATSPSGIEQTGIQLSDDGTQGDLEANDGIWTGQFINTADAGSYRFYFKSFGRNDRGELAPREATRYVTLTSPMDRPRPCDGNCNEPCLSCALQKWLWAIVIALLLLLLICCYRKWLRDR